MNVEAARKKNVGESATISITSPIYNTLLLTKL